MPPIKLVTYNILDGGLGRLDPIFETLLYLDADFVSLCEADDPRGAAYLADKLDAQLLLAESPTGDKHVAALTRLPVISMTNLGIAIPSLTRAAMQTIVNTASGHPLRIITMHLNAGQQPEDEQVRLAELAAILDYIAEPTMPTVLMGDLNACAPYHPIDTAAMAPHRRERLQARGGQLDHDVINCLTADGWIDAYHRLHRDAPRQTFTTGFPALRLDYVFLSQDLVPALVDGDVETGGFAPYCSDHFPLWISLRPPTAA